MRDTVVTHARRGGRQKIGISLNISMVATIQARLACPDGKENLSGPTSSSLFIGTGRRRRTKAFSTAITMMSKMSAGENEEK